MTDFTLSNGLLTGVVAGDFSLLGESTAQNKRKKKRLMM